MQELYTQQDYDRLSAQLKKRYLLLGIVCAALLASFITAMILRVEWLAMVTLFLLCAAALFVIDLFCLPLHRYRRLIGAALHGRAHTGTFEFCRPEEEISLVDGVRCRGLIFLGEPDKHGTREQRFYWDNEFPLPAFRQGEQVTIRYTGRNIIGYKL